MRNRRWPGLVVAAALAAIPGLARADGCKILLYADLPVTIDPGRRASVPVKINGHPTTFWLDSGAFFSIMSRAKALELQLAIKPVPAEGFRVVGIGGTADVGFATVNSFGYTRSDPSKVDFLVGGSDDGNGLIGANMLASNDTEFDLAHGSVKLSEAKDCRNVSLAYWAAGKTFFTVPLLSDPPGKIHGYRLPITLNGHRVIAELDTGSPQTLLSQHAAQAAGIDLKGPDSVPIGGISGFGRSTIAGWSVKVQDVGIGDEHVLASRIDVINGPILQVADSPDVLLGADFVMAHHIYVARNLRTIFFTYSGGTPFIASAKPPASQAPSANAQAVQAALPQGMHRIESVGNAAGAPTTADGFVRAASVRMDREDYAGAIADYTAAIKLAPTEPGYYRDRARAYATNAQLDLARGDIDKALSLDPKQTGLLIARGMLKNKEGDHAGAIVDLEAAAAQTPAASLDAAELASAFSKAGQPGRGAALLGPVIAAHSDDSHLGELLNNRCWSRALGNVEIGGALDDCNRAIRRFGPSPGALDSRALVRYRQGNFAAAVADYNAALKLDGKMAWSLFMRGAAKAKQGDQAGAKADQDAARAVKPDIAEEAARYGLP